MGTLILVIILIAYAYLMRRTYRWLFPDPETTALVDEVRRRRRETQWRYPTDDDYAPPGRSRPERDNKTRVYRDPLVEPSPTVPGVPKDKSVENYAKEGLSDLQIFMVQQARKRGGTSEKT